MLKFTGSSAVSSISISCSSIIPKSGLTIGIDLGDLRSHYCILDSAGTVVSRGTRVSVTVAILPPPIVDTTSTRQPAGSDSVSNGDRTTG